MYEQSNNNVVAWNTVTHGGDGLFVWAGQTTMDSGQGGVNDNLFFGNDFSWAPANGMEATFSRNTFVANLLEGNDYGLWGGYSFASKVIGNRFVRNRIGVAIEHGQDNAIEGNRFDHDTTAISLWANPIEPSDWGYPRHRDTRSRDYRIARNAFIGNRAGVRAVNTAGLLLLNNHWQDVDSMTVLRDTTGFRSEGNVDVAEARGVANDTMPPLSPEYAQLVPESLGGPRTLPPSGLARRDRSAMIVDEWGPYDWLSPKLWPVDSTRAVPLRLRVVGPGGRWRIAAQRGVDLVSSRSGRIGDTIAVTLRAHGPVEREVLRVDRQRHLHDAGAHAHRVAARLHVVSPGHRGPPAGEILARGDCDGDPSGRDLLAAHHQRRWRAGVGGRSPGDRRLDAARIGGRQRADCRRDTPAEGAALPGGRLDRAAGRDRSRHPALEGLARPALGDHKSRPYSRRRLL